MAEMFPPLRLICAWCGEPFVWTRSTRDWNQPDKCFLHRGKRHRVGGRAVGVSRYRPQ